MPFTSSTTRFPEAVCTPLLVNEISPIEDRALRVVLWDEFEADLLLQIPDLPASFEQFKFAGAACFFTAGVTGGALGSVLRRRAQANRNSAHAVAASDCIAATLSGCAGALRPASLTNFLALGEATSL
jgi:hypothetical protein